MGESGGRSRPTTTRSTMEHDDFTDVEIDTDDATTWELDQVAQDLALERDDEYAAETPLGHALEEDGELLEEP
jgi:hypothetical protein